MSGDPWSGDPAKMIGKPVEEVDADGFAKGARPLCPFCSKPWSAAMMHTSEEGYSYESCGEQTVTLDIVCDGCERLIYRKEVFDRWW